MALQEAFDYVDKDISPGLLKQQQQKSRGIFRSNCMPELKSC